MSMEKETNVKEKQPAERQAPIPGIILLFLGILLLLQTLNVIPWDLWRTLWRFWPVLIIIAGLSILLRRYTIWLMVGITIGFLLLSLGIAFWQYQRLPEPSTQSTGQYSQPLDGLDSASLAIDFAGGGLRVGSLRQDSTNMIETTGLNLREGNSTQGDEGRLEVSKQGLSWPLWDDKKNLSYIKLSRAIPLAVEVKSTASDVALDLTGLEITDLQMKTDLGNCTVRMPTRAGVTNVNMKGSLANIEITIPEGAAARVKVQKELSSVRVDETRFPGTGDYYVSPGFDTAPNRLEIEVHISLGRVEVK